MSIFSDRLRDLRAEKGKSQRQMAIELNISVPTLSHWECGYQEPSFRDLTALSNYFATSADYLLGLEDETGARVPAASTTAPPAAINDKLTAEERQLVEDFKKLTPHNKKYIQDTMQMVLNSMSTSLKNENKK